MVKRFISKREDGVLKVPAGFNTETIALDFVPEIIKVHFRDTRKIPLSEAPLDVVFWSLITSGDTAYLVISYDIYTPREIRYVATIPRVDPEATINF